MISFHFISKWFYSSFLCLLPTNEQKKCIKSLNLGNFSNSSFSILLYFGLSLTCLILCNTFWLKVVPLWNIPLSLEFHKDLVKDPFYIFFNMSPLSGIAGKFNLSYNINADDKRYLSFKPTIPDNGDLAMSNIKSRVNEVNHWVLMSNVNLNEDKTELLAFSV